MTCRCWLKKQSVLWFFQNWISPPRNPSSGWISITKSKSGFHGFRFKRSIGNSEKGFAKLSSWTAVFFLPNMRQRARPLFLRTVFQILFRIYRSNGKKEIQKQISQPWNPFSDFAFNFKSEIRILKSKSRFPNRFNDATATRMAKNNTFNEQNSNFARAAHFFVIPSPFLHDSNVKMPNFGFYRERKQATTKFYLSFWTWISPLGFQSTSGGFAYILQSKWVGIIAIKTERTQNLLFKRHSGCRRGCWILKVPSILQMTSLILKNSNKFYQR